MSNVQTTEVLCSILDMMKVQAQYQHRLHGWLIAVTETIQADPVLGARLVKQPFYDQGPRPDIQITESMIGNIDLLIRQLKNQKVDC
jgi:hypothetical protein